MYLIFRSTLGLDRPQFCPVLAIGFTFSSSTSVAKLKQDYECNIECSFVLVYYGVLHTVLQSADWLMRELIAAPCSLHG
jgi:hypothetical protein